MKTVTGRTFCRALSRSGWSHIRTEGSHQTWQKQGVRTVTVPVHAGKDLKPGLQARLMKLAGLREEDL